MNKPVIDNLTQLLGKEGLSEVDADRALFSEDIWAKGELADFVISPETTQQLSDAVALAHRAGVSLNPRGGGMSYTKGYTPDRAGTAMLDLSRMNRIVEVNAADMTVTVQAGVTWAELHAALAPKGLRTPFWGPLSGLSSTIGGGLSQNNAFFGAGTHGPSTDSVTSLTVVLADGTIVKTGTAASPKGKPFWRQYGPDLTGLFLSDAGAFGYKAEATLRLIPLPTNEDHASFEFADAERWAEAMAEMGRLGFACELFGFDPNLQVVRMKRASLAADFKTLGNVVTKAKGGLMKGLKDGAKVVLSGRNFIDQAAYSLHWIVEGYSAGEVAAKMDRLKQIAADRGGKEIENSIPKIMRTNPFGPLNSVLGPHGERWVPIHGIVSMGDGPACVAAMDKMFAGMKPELDAHEITTGYLLTTLSTNGYLVEPVFIWPEEIHPIHERTVDVATLKRAKRFEANPAATALVTQARQNVMDIFTEFGAAHFQIGRTYPYLDNMSDEAKQLLQGIKALLDPDGRVNPGSLGLNPCT
ncbi:MAG: FAD-binding oxidoreductase [Pseudomonadota bacterium]